MVSVEHTFKFAGTVQDQQDCDSTTGSGDCGFRDTGCSTTSFEVTLTTGNDTDSLDKDDEVLIPLLKNTTSDTCHIFVCLPCLASSGYTVTEKLIPTPTPTEARVMKRRKRSTTQFHAGTYNHTHTLTHTHTHTHKHTHKHTHTRTAC